MFIEFLKNMITGASHAEAALLVIDANEGVQENSRRHGYMLSMLGVKQIAVIVNKMDLVEYNEDIYNNIVKEYTAFLNKINVEAKAFIPVSGINGDNITSKINAMDWSSGKTVLDVLDEFTSENFDTEMNFRMAVQDVYKFTRFGDSRRIVAGSIQTGTINVGDEVVFYPSGKKSIVQDIESFNAAKTDTASAPYATGFTLQEQIYIKRGEMAVKATEEKPEVASQIKCSLFWLGKKPLIFKKEYHLKIGSIKVFMKLEKINRIMDASDLKYSTDKNQINRHDVAECVLTTSKPIAFDIAEKNPLTSRFVIVDDFEIRGGGIILEALDDRQKNVREKVLLRNYKWEKSGISKERRAERYNQKSTLILVTGEKNTGKKTIARELEKQLFNDGKIVFFMGIGNILYGVDADIKDEPDKDTRHEHIRRLAEVSHIMMESGVILIVTAVGLSLSDIELIKTTVDPDRIETIWVGDNVTTDIHCDSYIDSDFNVNEAVGMIKGNLQDKGIIFKPW